VATPYGEAADDAAVEAIEGQQPGGTRMLVALVFPFRWPGFGWSADQAEWAARNMGGLSPWPELQRVVIPDEREPVWWVAYLSSPAWWLAILAALGVFIAVAITVRIVWVVTPQEVRGGLGLALTLLPIVVVAVAVSLIPPLLKGLAPGATGAVGRKLPGSALSLPKGG
jgi:hypothetical protein